MLMKFHTHMQCENTSLYHRRSPHTDVIRQIEINDLGLSGAVIQSAGSLAGLSFRIRTRWGIMRWNPE